MPQIFHLSALYREIDYPMREPRPAPPRPIIRMIHCEPTDAYKIVIRPVFRIKPKISSVG